VVSLETLGWTATVDDIDLSARTVRAHTDRPLQSAEAVIIGTDAQPLASVAGDLTDPQRPSFTWLPTDEVLQIAITATDVHGFVSTLKLSPWSYAIPHEDVVFATGQTAVDDVETQKLEKTFADIQAVLERYGTLVDIELFVVGYTDTVGASSANQVLSERRARSIARWFKTRGFPGAVHSQGFGESVLAVATDDEVDEIRNRRVLYLLAASPPRTSEAIPRRNWRRQ
jgi:outer membrane protein OmpA-like peptidoglycan-associated protein